MSRSISHSYICDRILRQLHQNPEIQTMPELTLDIDTGLTPDISVYEVNILELDFQDLPKCPHFPKVAIEVISLNQNIPTLVKKAGKYLEAGIPYTWVVDPYTQTVILIDQKGQELIHQGTIEKEGIQVDFAEVFSVKKNQKT